MSALILWGLLSFANTNAIADQCDFLVDGRLDMKFLNYGSIAILTDNLDRKVCSFSLVLNENQKDRGHKSIVSKFIPIEKCKVGKRDITYISTRTFLSGEKISKMDISTNIDSNLICKKKM